MWRLLQELLAELEIGQPLGRGSYGRVYRGAPLCPLPPPLASTIQCQPCCVLYKETLHGHTVALNCNWHEWSGALCLVRCQDSSLTQSAWQEHGVKGRRARRAGKWKGVQVAVKIVEHNSEADRDLSQLRESVLSTAIQHPNVVRAPPAAPHLTQIQRCLMMCGRKLYVRSCAAGGDMSAVAFGLGCPGLAALRSNRCCAASAQRVCCAHDWRSSHCQYACSI